MMYQVRELDSANSVLYLQSFLVALRLDAVIAAFLLLPILLTIFWSHLVLREALYSKVLQLYLSLATIFISSLSMIDIFFYEEFNTHLNILLLQDNVFRIESIKFLWYEYPIILIVISTTLVTWLGHHAYKLIGQRISPKVSKWPVWISAWVLSMIFTLLAIRGGWQNRPIDWGYAMFSDDNAANQIALNGIFLLGRSAIELSSEKNLRNNLHFVSNEKALQSTRDLILGTNEVFVDDHSLSRKLLNPKTIKPNIVLVILESHVGSYCGYINPEEKGVTPVLDSLANQGIGFTHCISNGQRSAFGISSILMSWPVLPGLPLISQIEATREVPCIAASLKEIGYRNIFLYGGDSQFDNMQGFAKTNGYDQVIDQKDLPAHPGTMWGIFDHYLFDYAKGLLDKATEPLQLTMFTTSNHQPWEFPDAYSDRIPDFPKATFRQGNVHKTMRYVDLVIGEFMESASSAPWFDNTIFVFVSDHGLTVYREQFEDLRNGSIPLVIYAPGILTEPRRIDTPVSQADIMPTLMGMIGYPNEFVAMGRDALNSDGAFASRITNDYMLWLDKDMLYSEILGQSSGLVKISNFHEMHVSDVPASDSAYARIQNQYHAYIQTAFTQFKALGH